MSGNQPEELTAVEGVRARMSKYNDALRKKVFTTIKKKPVVGTLDESKRDVSGYMSPTKEKKKKVGMIATQIGTLSSSIKTSFENFAGRKVTQEEEIREELRAKEELGKLLEETQTEPDHQTQNSLTANQSTPSDQKKSSESVNSLPKQTPPAKTVNFNSIRLRYIKAIAECRPKTKKKADVSDEFEEAPGDKKSQRKVEVQKKERFVRLRQAWDQYEVAARDKPKLSNPEETEIRQEIDKVENEVVDTWVDYSKTIVQEMMVEMEEKLSKDGGDDEGDDDEDDDMDYWINEAKRLKAEAEARRKAREEYLRQQAERERAEEEEYWMAEALRLKELNQGKKRNKKTARNSEGENDNNQLSDQNCNTVSEEDGDLINPYNDTPHNTVPPGITKKAAHAIYSDLSKRLPAGSNTNSASNQFPVSKDRKASAWLKVKNSINPLPSSSAQTPFLNNPIFDEDNDSGEKAKFELKKEDDGNEECNEVIEIERNENFSHIKKHLDRFDKKKEPGVFATQRGSLSSNIKSTLHKLAGRKVSKEQDCEEIDAKKELAKLLEATNIALNITNPSTSETDTQSISSTADGIQSTPIIANCFMPKETPPMTELDFKSISTIYMKAIDECRPRALQKGTEEYVEVPVDRKFQRKVEAQKKERFGSLRKAWDRYVVVAPDKPKLLTPGESEILQQIDKVEDEVVNSWVEYSDTVVAEIKLEIKQKKLVKKNKDDDNEEEDDDEDDMDYWINEAKRLKLEADARRKAREDSLRQQSESEAEGEEQQEQNLNLLDDALRLKGLNRGKLSNVRTPEGHDGKIVDNNVSTQGSKEPACEELEAKEELGKLLDASMQTRPSASATITEKSSSNSSEKKGTQTTANGLAPKETLPITESDFKSIRTTYMKAIDECRPRALQKGADESVDAPTDVKFQRKVEAQKKERFVSLRKAWDRYKVVAPDKPIFSTPGESEIQRQIDKVEDDVINSWVDYSHAVVEEIKLEMEEKLAKESNGKGDDDDDDEEDDDEDDLDYWINEAKRLKAEADARRKAREGMLNEQNKGGEEAEENWMNEALRLKELHQGKKKQKNSQKSNDDGQFFEHNSDGYEGEVGYIDADACKEVATRTISNQLRKKEFREDSADYKSAKKTYGRSFDDVSDGEEIADEEISNFNKETTDAERAFRKKKDFAGDSVDHEKVGKKKSIIVPEDDSEDEYYENTNENEETGRRRKHLVEDSTNDKKTGKKNHGQHRFDDADEDGEENIASGGNGAMRRKKEFEVDDQSRKMTKKVNRRFNDDNVDDVDESESAPEEATDGFDNAVRRKKQFTDTSDHQKERKKVPLQIHDDDHSEKISESAPGSDVSDDDNGLHKSEGNTRSKNQSEDYPDTSSERRKKNTKSFVRDDDSCDEDDDKDLTIGSVGSIRKKKQFGGDNDDDDVGMKMPKRSKNLVNAVDDSDEEVGGEQGASADRSARKKKVFGDTAHVEKVKGKSLRRFNNDHDDDDDDDDDEEAEEFDEPPHKDSEFVSKSNKSKKKLSRQKNEFGGAKKKSTSSVEEIEADVENNQEANIQSKINNIRRKKKYLAEELDADNKKSGKRNLVRKDDDSNSPEDEEDIHSLKSGVDKIRKKKSYVDDEDDVSKHKNNKKLLLGKECISDDSSSDNNDEVEETENRKRIRQKQRKIPDNQLNEDRNLGTGDDSSSNDVEVEEVADSALVADLAVKEKLKNRRKEIIDSDSEAHAGTKQKKKVLVDDDQLSDDNDGNDIEDSDLLMSYESSRKHNKSGRHDLKGSSFTKKKISLEGSQEVPAEESIEEITVKKDKERRRKNFDSESAYVRSSKQKKKSLLDSIDSDDSISDEVGRPVESSTASGKKPTRKKKIITEDLRDEHTGPKQKKSLTNRILEESDSDEDEHRGTRTAQKPTKGSTRSSNTKDEVEVPLYNDTSDDEIPKKAKTGKQKRSQGSGTEKIEAVGSNRSKESFSGSRDNNQRSDMAIAPDAPNNYSKAKKGSGRRNANSIALSNLDGRHGKVTKKPQSLRDDDEDSDTEESIKNSTALPSYLKSSSRQEYDSDASMSDTVATDDESVKNRRVSNVVVPFQKKKTVEIKDEAPALEQKARNLDGSNWTYPLNKWLNEPEKKVIIKNTQISMSVPLGTDCWRRTLYGFSKDNAPFHFQQVSSAEFEVLVNITCNFSSNYQKAGLMIRVDDSHWMFTGMEYMSGRVYLSTIATNHSSDRTIFALPQNAEVAGVWFCMKMSSRGVESYYSFDGKTWKTARQCILVGDSVASVGICGASPTGVGLVVNFDYYRCTLAGESVTLRFNV